MATVAAARPQKRSRILAFALDNVPLPLPSAKRARLHAGMKKEADHEKEWMKTAQDGDGSAEDEDGSDAASDSRPSSPGCSLTADAQSIAETSFTSASTKRPKKYLCEYEDCGKAFDRPVRLQMHIRSHTNERLHACGEEDCGKTFLRSEHLARHMKDKHSEEKSHVCDYVVSTATNDADVVCGKSFTTATRLRRHVAQHEAKEETKCQEPGCGKVFRKQETLQRHIKQDHLHEKAFRCTHIESTTDDQQTQCDHAFARAYQLKKHIAREHSGVHYFCDICSPNTEPPDDNDDDDDDNLSTPRVGFPTYADLQAHLHHVHPPTCTLCAKQCASARALKAHIDIEHTALTERLHHPCTWPGCERAFTKSGNLKVHVQNVHSKARNFVCGEFDLAGNEKVAGWGGRGCGGRFGTKANLEEHVRTQHLGIPGKLKRKDRVKGDGNIASASRMDEDGGTASNDAGRDDGNALSLLTGFGYASAARKIACVVYDCQVRFTNSYLLAQHLELTHGWHVDDVNDALAEKEALEGGRFWIGGQEPTDEADEKLRRRLEEALLQPAVWSAPVGGIVVQGGW
ncbi:hypothetical protein LTR08_008292 [Meristemomyces frigidus]|nr:hypothetical protein LTR08_008292 [Meristemomyces frigidus]